MRHLLYFVIGCLLFFSCSSDNEEEDGYTYVKPSVDSRGRYRKGHVRKKTSTSKDAIKNRNRSKYYYETRGKYKKRKSKRD